MTRRTRTLRAAIAMATVGLLLAGCSDEADSVDPLTEGSASGVLACGTLRPQPRWSNSTTR